MPFLASGTSPTLVETSCPCGVLVSASVVTLIELDGTLTFK